MLFAGAGHLVRAHLPTHFKCNTLFFHSALCYDIKVAKQKGERAVSTTQSNYQCIKRRKERLAKEGSTKNSDIGHNRSRLVYQGKPCLRGHSGERYASGHCVECHRLKISAWMKKKKADPRELKRIRKTQNIATRKWAKKELKTRPDARTENRIRTNIHAWFTGRVKKSRSVCALLGVADLREYKSYLEKKFAPGMSWDNYGRDGWGIDHIVPTRAFNLQDADQLLQAFNYQNTQPMWHRDNARKSCAVV